MTLVTTNPKLAQLAVELAGERTGWPTKVIPLEDGWIVRNAYVELPEATIRQEFSRRQRQG